MSQGVAVIGCGYVGLVAGACLAHVGYRVVCHDADRARLRRLRKGDPIILEPGLEALIAEGLASGRLRFEDRLERAMAGATVALVAVGTPSIAGTDRADLSQVEQAVTDIAASAAGPLVIVVKSTVPVGTNRRLAVLATRAAGGKARVALASNPEFLRQGSAVADFLDPDRIVIGADEAATADKVAALYAPLATRTRIVSTSPESAELVKYAANSFLAVKVSFVNEIADLCEATGADIADVTLGMGLDHRIGPAFLKPGPGWGGSCFPKDSRALLATGKARDVALRVTDAAILSNTARKAAMARRIARVLGGSLRGKRIAVFGLTFKGGTDDMRDSPALDILPLLAVQGATVCAFDPANPPDAARLLPGIGIVPDPVTAARGADACVVLADWPCFRALDWKRIADVMADPVLIDLRNMLDADAVRRAGFRLFSRVGRADAGPVMMDGAAAPTPATVAG
jgi:UDPglucose 6-dehydrogenase